MKTADLQEYGSEAIEQLQQARNLSDLEDWYRAHLGRSGRLTWWKKQVGQLEPAERPQFGKTANEIGARLETAFQLRKEQLKLEELAVRMRAEAVDVTLPPRPRRTGGYHPSTLMLRRIREVFGLMGFAWYDTPNVELDEYNFTLLNIPPHHPARDMQDTFFVSPEVVLRTHTSPGQIRVMRERAPEPIRVILPGLCYRNEDVTPRSEMQFHQVEGLLVGPNVRMSDLKGVLLLFARMVFGENQQVRLRGSYFPFTEPSVEVDIRCTLCSGSGCRVCKHTGWLELLGAGMVHPNVLRNGGYDPEKVRGFAFGMGIERMLLLLHGISDIRYFFQNDLRFLEQFS